MDLREDCSVPKPQGGDNNDNDNGNNNGIIKSNFEVKKCSDCQTTTTPLWRGGPAGPKTLCNACGIKYHKKRRALLGINKQQKADKFKSKNTNNINNNIINNLNMPIKIKVISSSSSSVNRQRQRQQQQSDKFSEVERAALLLMALSYGSVYA